jgi:hypothetical protein
MSYECSGHAPGLAARVTKHSVFIHYQGKLGILPKGAGIPRGATIEALRGVGVDPAKVRKLAQNLVLDPQCVNRFFRKLVAVPDRKRGN